MLVVEGHSRGRLSLPLAFLDVKLAFERSEIQKGSRVVRGLFGRRHVAPRNVGVAKKVHFAKLAALEPPNRE